jgi:hypothetical protein
MTKQHADYIPSKDSLLVIWARNFIKILGQSGELWGVTTEELNELKAADASFETMVDKVDSPSKTSVLVASKNEARKKLVALIRALVNFKLRNPAITDPERVLLGIPVHDTTRTPIPTPDIAPAFEIQVYDIRRLSVAYHHSEGKSKAKPYGVNGAVVIYDVLDAPPTHPTALTRGALATRSPHILDFAEEERGQTAYVAICWQNEKGERGPWSPILSSVVP